MFEVTKDFSWRVREKRARQRITATRASEQIGITRQTLRFVERGEGKIKKSVYQKIVNWLVAEE
ncbi:MULTISPECIES: helix-turn-helix domain-containing protein [Enterococcus]|uniref:Helix-turn-helix transcriptional regulator n=1 Tax=Enterococcus lactis TaxID=357441 RepID=A0AAJ1SN56_9ENTE|nr:MULTISPECIES: helix-turn-helix transcriptional regulator [Enterococcus]MDP8584453.1 helix-turn-helix transcriptional regulator [Listeria innocua]KGQ79516.1 hypothetical protein OP03_00320 [Enterococcus faecium]MBK4858880.1 hypothetical protein [Enterococcus faecium]MDP8591398.1 helix-turn-helix transcriptional regulator [Enterococcus lactis]NJE63734.1 XRE family transcriptional regulator [Enterococcus durans]